MKYQNTIPFIGGIKDGHRVTTDEYPQPWVRVIERPAIDFVNTEFDPATPASFKEHVYELKGTYDGVKFYIPLSSDPGDALSAALDKYPAPPDHTKITVPVNLLYDVLRQIGGPAPDLTKIRRIYSLISEHYRNHPPE